MDFAGDRCGGDDDAPIYDSAIVPSTVDKCGRTTRKRRRRLSCPMDMAREEAEAVLERVRNVGRAGDFGSGPFRRDSADLCRRVQLLSHLLEEIRDSKCCAGGGGSGSSSASSSAARPAVADCLRELGLALDATKRLILVGRSTPEGSPDALCKRITFKFQFVTWQLEKVLGGIPYDHFDISDEVQEQVELVRAQLKRAMERNRPVNLNLLSDISSLMAKADEVDPQELNRLLKKVQTENMGNDSDDLQVIVELFSEIYGMAEHDDQKKSLLELMSSDKNEVDKPNSDSNNLAETALEENKKPEVATIPADFLCPISLELMRDPVIVATGQTYERSSIQRWIDCGYKTCPKTQQMLQNMTLTPNYVLRSLIQQWCEENQIEQPLGVISGRMKNSDGSIQDVSGDRTLINALVRKLSSSSLEEQRNAASEIRLLAKRSSDNRILIADAGAVPLLVDLLSVDDLRTQEHAVTSLLNLSIYENNKSLIMLAGAVPHIVEVLKRGSMEARENAAATIFSLSLVDENKIVIGASGAIKALVDLLQRGSSRGKKDAATALFNLCIYQGNKARAVRAGILVPLMKMLTDSSDCMVDEALTILSVLASHQEGKVAIAKANAIPVLIDLLRTDLPRNKENAAAILLALCKKDVENLACIGRLGAVIPLTELARNGTDRAKRKANSLLEHLGKIKQM